MRPVRHLTPILLSFVLLVLPGFAKAQDQARASIRSAGHGEYSRLVFEWPKAVSYTLERPEPGKLIVRFGEGSELNTSGFESVPNVSGLAVVSEQPLAISVVIPEKSRTRDMAAGNRVIVDVYNPPEPVPPKKDEKSKTPPPEKKKASPEKPAEKSAEKTEVKPKEEAKDSVLDKKEPDKKEPDKKENAQKEPEKAALPTPAAATQIAPETVRLKPRVPPTIIVLSSTQSFGVAAFELAGRLFIVNDKSDILTSPQISGPQVAQIGKMDELKAGHGKAYVVSLPSPTALVGQGEGLVWRLLVGGDLEEKRSDPPQRKDVDPDKDRSGELFVPLENARSLIDVEDPATGQVVKAVTVLSASAFAGPARSFVDFDILRSPVGLAVVPKVDDLEIAISPEGVTISRPGGLTMVGEEKARSAAGSDEPIDENIPRLFDFRGWQLGGISAIAENRTIILGGLNGQDESTKIEGLLTLAKMYLSNAMGTEALGILRLAEQEMPALKDSPEFGALVGVAHALSRHMEDAFDALSQEKLKPFIETGYWRSYALASLGDWQQAAAILPRSIAVLGDYPDALLNRLGPVLAEVALKAGDVPLGTKILDRLEKSRSTMEIPQLAALDYLKGELARQKGSLDEARRLWEPLAKGADDLYRVRASLALTRLEMDRDKADTGKIIDALERLRYAWRGDELESQVSYWLGRAYFQSGDYIKGLKIMREGTTFAPGTDLSKRIAGDMVDLFTSLFLGKDFEKLSPLDAVTLYDQFPELVPLDDRGNRIAERLAEYLVEADLLDRAGNLLAYQIQHRLTGEGAFRAAMRLAAIRLLDNQPAKALEALESASRRIEMLPDQFKTPENYRALAMLRARAYFRQGHPDRALALLRGIEQVPDVNRLRADIAWTAGYWGDAAEALENVLADQNISMTRPLEDKDAALLMQRAIALNLAGDRVALANMREKYTDLMNQTDKAKAFEVITRPRQSSALADRETLLGIVSEVDLFADFLNSYKKVQPASAE